MKASGAFKFKKFNILHHQSTMKVGTDAVIIGAWTNMKEAQRILDIGTGCGLIAIMQAQKHDKAQIVGIDIHENSVKEASLNVSGTPWHNRIIIKHESLQDHQSINKYDLIISNPPFFTAGTASPIEARKNARHNASLTFSSLVFHVNRLLSETGHFSIIIPTEAKKEIIEEAKKNNLFPNKILNFKPRENKPIVRNLILFSRISQKPITETLMHYEENGQWTSEYIRLTEDFYLNL